MHGLDLGFVEVLLICATEYWIINVKRFSYKLCGFYLQFLTFLTRMEMGNTPL
ncbi:hypothetical protein PL11201_30059 [Planktothrix sp. PCC 11201]|nr:hypothetical protein PL11201_30059 [Planktothrix sp. PCC 11201]